MNKFRLRVTDSIGNRTYIARSEDGHVSCFGQDLTPLSLSYISRNAAELRFALEDAVTGEDAWRATQQYIYAKHTVNLL